MSKKDEALKLAMNKAFQLGQRYWSWADSEYSSHWKKADAAKSEFDQLVQDTIDAALAEQDDPDLQDKAPELVEQHYKQVVDGVRAAFDAKRKQPAQQQEPLTPREVELLDGMIEVQLHHASQCDGIANRAMAEKQKVWDMERVKLLRKLKAAHGITGEQK